MVCNCYTASKETLLYVRSIFICCSYCLSCNVSTAMYFVYVVFVKLEMNLPSPAPEFIETRFQT